MSNHKATSLVPRTSFNPLRSLPLLRAALLLSLGAIAGPTIADNGAVYVAPGPSTLLSPDAISRNQAQFGGSARKLGDLLAHSLSSPTSHATDLIVTTQCGRYKSATITFSDGSARTLNLSNAPATQQDMAQAKAAIPILRIIDLTGCDG
jgi:hypothetical protein